MAERRKQKKGGMRKHGRCLRKASKMNYKTRGQRKINKLKRVLQSNGDAAHRRYRRDAHRRGDIIYFPSVKRNLPVNYRAIAHVNKIMSKYTFANLDDAQAFIDEVMNGDIPNKDVS